METVLIASSVLLWIVLICNVLLTLALVRKANQTSANRKPMPLPEGLKEGTKAPAFRAQTLDETTVVLEDFSNKTALFVFIALHCGACEEILLSLNAMRPQMADTELVLISNSTVEESRTLAKEHVLTLPLLSAPKRENPFFYDYKIHVTPTYYLINAQGLIQATGIPGEHNAQWKQLAASLTEQTSTV